MVMAVVQQKLEQPGAVRLPAHGIGRGIPAVKITSQVHLLCSRRNAYEIDRFRHIPRGVAAGGEQTTNILHETAKTFLTC